MVCETFAGMYAEHIYSTPQIHYKLVKPTKIDLLNQIKIIFVLQVSLEGEISRQSVLNSLHRGQRASGDLIPWTISQQFQDDKFPQLSGARIVRIATHPDFQGVGETSSF